MPLQLSELLQPIGEDAPGGASLRYQPIYEQIKQARLEEDELPSGEWSRERKTADYALVARLASDALAKRSKDLQIAAWLTEALLKREGFGGLATGLRLLASLVSDFWDHLYPELDEDGDVEFRAAPLEWVGQYLDRAARLVPLDGAGHTMAQYRQSRSVGYEADATSYAAKDARKAAIAAGQMTGEDWDTGFNATSKEWYRQLVTDADAALEALDALDLVCQERFGVDAPRFSPLRDAIAEVRQEATPLFALKLKAEPDPVVEEPAPQEVVQAMAGNGGAPGAGADTAAAGDGAGSPAAALAASPAPGTRADAEARLAAIARFLRGERPTDPAPYLLLRGFRWGELRASDGRLDPSMLVAPSTEVRTRLKTLLLAERWRELLEVGEEAMAGPAGRAWLDLQRYTVAACDALAGEHARIGAAVRSELRALLRDLPALVSTTLTDDTPSANGDTLAWLRAEGLLADGPGDAAPISLLRGDPLHQAQQLARAGQAQKAVDLLMREASQERSARGRFLRRSQAATIMVESGMDAVALPILQQLVEQVQRFSLEEWEESDTVTRTLGLLYRCLNRLQGANATTQELYLRICRLDPMYALQLQAAS